jgi:hypothetical protein
MVNKYVGKFCNRLSVAFVNEFSMILNKNGFAAFSNIKSANGFAVKEATTNERKYPIVSISVLKKPYLADKITQSTITTTTIISRINPKLIIRLI